MNPTIKNGDLVLVRQQPDVEDGEIAAVLMLETNEATLKKGLNEVVVWLSCCQIIKTMNRLS